MLVYNTTQQERGPVRTRSLESIEAVIRSKVKRSMSDTASYITHSLMKADRKFRGRNKFLFGSKVKSKLSDLISFFHKFFTMPRIDGDNGDKCFEMLSFVLHRFLFALIVLFTADA